MNETIQMNLFDYFLDDESFTISQATEVVKNIRNMQVNDESIRARIYEGVDKGIFKKLSRGVYQVSSQLENGEKTNCILINGNGRDLSMIEDGSIDGIVTDHPYDVAKALTGGNRKFASYELFKYQKEDFAEKQRVLKPGAFLVEFLPEESEMNWEYLFEIKQMAKAVGFKYFAKVLWKKGSFVANTGRKSKNIEDVMIFSNGEPRTLKLDAKKNLEVARHYGLSVSGKTSYEVKELLEENELEIYYIKGTNGMLPAILDYQPRSRNEKVMEAEKPVPLLEEIIEYISLPYETLLDQFGGSGNFAVACTNKARNCIIIEKDEETFQKLKNNVESQTQCHAYEIDLGEYDDEEEDFELS